MYGSPPAARNNQAQLDALSGARCRKVVVETASTRGDRPKLRTVLDQLQPGDAAPAVTRPETDRPA
jgi:hypothetical protein